jgi:hypothetical protein
MTDVIDYTIVRKTYESYLKEITYCKNDKELRLVIKRFLDFLKDMYLEAIGEKLRTYIQRHIKIARNILTLMKLKYLIFFIYNFLLERLVKELINAIKYFTSVI